MDFGSRFADRYQPSRPLRRCSKRLAFLHQRSTGTAPLLPPAHAILSTASSNRITVEPLQRYSIAATARQFSNLPQPLRARPRNSHPCPAPAGLLDLPRDLLLRCGCYRLCRRFYELNILSFVPRSARINVPVVPFSGRIVEKFINNVRTRRNFTYFQWIFTEAFQGSHECLHVRDLPRHQELQRILRAGVVAEIDQPFVDDLGAGF